MTQPPGDAPPEATSAPDLELLLAQRRLLHWLEPLLCLCQRHHGWLADYEFDPELDPDFRPLCDTLDAVLQVPASPEGDDSALAHALAQSNFMARSAVDRQSGQLLWNPLAEPYRAFAKRHPGVVPFWSDAPKDIEVRLVAWVQTFTHPKD